MSGDKRKRAKYLIRELEKDVPGSADYPVPDDPDEAFDLFRALCNVRMPGAVSDEFLTAEKEYLEDRTRTKGVTDAAGLQPVPSDSRLVLWQGDITTLKCDAIVNAANSQMLGCFRPLHNCIDNMIHTMAGVELRNECSRQMEALRQKYGKNYEQPTSDPLITPGYHLPAKYVIHVVGPIAAPFLKKEHKEQLADCYTRCLAMAGDHACESVAFCCISTGVFLFPQDKAAEIAVDSVKEWLDAHPESSVKRVIFNVFKDSNLAIYQKLLV